MDKNIILEAKKWASNTYFDENSRKEIVTLLDNNDQQEILERFHKNIEFGTGGLRSIVGMGSNRMSKYIVRKATQAMCNVLKNQGVQNGRFALSYDCRHFSYEFACEAASVIAGNNFTAFIFKELTPTPMLSYAVRYLKADAGIMITASHNPPNYNGFKAYGADGAQVTPPLDKNIINEFNKIKDWNSIHYTEFNEALKDNSIQWIKSDLIDSYDQVILNQTKNLKLCQEHGADLKIVYTPLHGTGYKPCERILKKMGFKDFNIVESQKNPDPNFTTVKSPNPEDAEALTIAVKQMLETGGDIVYGTDPDGDRLGVVINVNNKPQYLNGNQIGVLMLHYIFESLKEQSKIPTNPLVIKSIVTSPLFDAITHAHKGKIVSTLTGFKWMARVLKEYEEQNKPFDFIFACEESFGYMGHMEARDKDGISAMALMSECALYYKRVGKNLNQVLDDIYTKYGFYQEGLLALSYQGLEGSQKIQNIMNYFRNYKDEKLLGETIAQIDDYQTLKKNDVLRDEQTNIDSFPSNVLAFHFKSGSSLYLRPSGTEPKIKFYSQVYFSEGTLSDNKHFAANKIRKFESTIKELVENL